MASTLLRTLLTPAFAFSHLQTQLHSHRGCWKTFDSSDTWTSIPVSYKAALVAHIASLATPPSEFVLSKWNLSGTLGIRIIQIILERTQSHPSLSTPLFMQKPVPLVNIPTSPNTSSLAAHFQKHGSTRTRFHRRFEAFMGLGDLPQLHMVDPLISTGNNQIIVMAAKHGHTCLFSTLQSHPRIVKRISELDRVALGVAAANNQTEIISLILDHSSSSSLASKMERVVGVALECVCVGVVDIVEGRADMRRHVFTAFVANGSIAHVQRSWTGVSVFIFLLLRCDGGDNEIVCPSFISKSVCTAVVDSGEFPKKLMIHGVCRWLDIPLPLRFTPSLANCS